MTPLPEICTLFAFGMPGPTEWIIIAIIGLLIFGRRLPEVGRSLGRSIVEFKRGIKGLDEEIDTEATRRNDSATPPRIQSSPSIHAADRGTAEAARHPAEQPNPFASAGDPERPR